MSHIFLERQEDGAAECTNRHCSLDEGGKSRISARHLVGVEGMADRHRS